MKDALSMEWAFARAAIERRDSKNYQQILHEINGYVCRIWPPSVERQQALTALNELAGAQLTIHIPELGTTLGNLHSLQQGREQQ